MADERLGHSVARGVAWSFTEKVLTIIIQMVVSIIVARELMPEAFGVMAILTFFTSVALTVVDSGFSQTLIRKADVSDEEYCSVLGFNVVMSLLLYVALVSVVEPLAEYYAMPMIGEVAAVLFLVLPINALCVVQTVMYTREFRFALLSKVVLAASVISGGVAVVMALAGYGIWALVMQRLLQMGIKAAAFWLLRRWNTTASFSFRALLRMAPFSLRLLATDLIASIYNNVAQLFIGKMHSATTLGYYSQGQKLKDLPVTSTVQAVQGVTYPALAKLKDEPVQLADAYLRIMRLLSFVLFPAMLGLIAIAPEMFAVLLGERWMPTVPYFEILALAGLLHPLTAVSYNILKVCSNGRAILYLEIAKRVIMTLMLIYTIPRGVEAIAWGMSAMAAVDFLITTTTAHGYLHLPIGRLLRAVMPQLLLAAVMFGVLYFGVPLIQHLGVSEVLLVKIGVGVLIYLCGAFIFRLRAASESIELLKGLLRPKNE